MGISVEVAAEVLNEVVASFTVLYLISPISYTFTLWNSILWNTHRAIPWDRSIEAGLLYLFNK